MKSLSVLTWLLAITVTIASGQSRTVESIKDETSVTYRLHHPLHTMEATSRDAVFRATVNPSTKSIDSVSARVDVTTFDSGNSNRDSHAMETIDAITYPDVTFSSTRIVPQGDSLVVTGPLTFHGVTNNIMAIIVPEWSSNKLAVQGIFSLSLTAFKIDRPSLLMLPVSDTLRFSLRTAFAIQ